MMVMEPNKKAQGHHMMVQGLNMREQGLNMKGLVQNMMGQELSMKELQELHTLNLCLLLYMQDSCLWYLWNGQLPRTQEPQHKLALDT